MIHVERLAKEVRRLERTGTGSEVRKRMRKFESFKEKPTREWFSELCFCLLTANAKFKTAYAIQRELGHRGFAHSSLDELVECIKRNKHRFHNNKAKFIIEARKHAGIKRIISRIIHEQGEFAAREFLVAKVKGLGYKEASHFLRNTGCKNLAIIDRHILSVMKEYGLVRSKPKAVSRKTYLALEEKLQKVAGKLGMPVAALDLYLWSMKTGVVMK